jgi:hypothetical protein
MTKNGLCLCRGLLFCRNTMGRARGEPDSRKMRFLLVSKEKLLDINDNDSYY